MRFSGMPTLAKWLTHSAAGQDLLEEALEAQAAMRTRALVVLGPDGQVEIYGKKDLWVQAVHKLDTPCETLAERYVEMGLGPQFERLYVPGRLRWQGSWQRRTAEEELQRLWNLKLVRTCRRIQEGISHPRKKGLRPR